MTNLVEPPICGPDVPPPCVIIEPCQAFNVCAPQPVPTLSEWSLIGLGVVILICAVNHLWRRTWK